jgi:hypothetical protein
VTHNQSAVTWPGLTAYLPGTVAVQARWWNAETGALASQSDPSPIAIDLGGGESVDVQVNTMMPPPGRYRLELDLLQVGVGLFPPDSGGRLERMVISKPFARPQSAVDSYPSETRATVAPPERSTDGR